MAFIIFIAAVKAMIQHKAANRKLFMFASSLLMSLATLHLAGVCVRTFDGFVVYPLGPKKYFALLSTKENLATQAGQIGAILLTDLFTVFRVYEVCHLPSSSRRVQSFFPLALAGCAFIGTFVSGVVFVQIQRFTDPNASYFTQPVYRWTLSFLGLSLLTTALSTGIIASELWKRGHQSKGHALNDDCSDYGSGDYGKSLFLRVLWIFVESAALYSLNNLIYLILFAAHTAIQPVFSTLTSPIASITFSAVILRLQKAGRSPDPIQRPSGRSNPNAPLTHLSNANIENLALGSLSTRT